MFMVVFMRLFVIVYFCVGVGFVVSVIFIVVLVDELSGLEGKGVWVFLVMGLVVVLSVIFWDFIVCWIGNVNVMVVVSLL